MLLPPAGSRSLERTAVRLIPLFLLCLSHGVCVASRTEARSMRWSDLVEQATAARSASDYTRSLSILDSAMTLATSVGDQYGISSVLVEQALVHQLMDEYGLALSMLYRAKDIRERIGERAGLAEVHNNIGAIHQYQRSFDKAMEDYGASLAIYKELGMQKKVGMAYNNFGSLHEDMKEPMVAIDYHRKSLDIWQSLQDSGWMGVSYMNMGTCLELLGDLDSARTLYLTSMKLFSKRNGRYMATAANINLGMNHLQAGSHAEALRWCDQGLALAEEIGASRYQERACQCLYKAYEAIGDTRRAYESYKRYVQLKDSLFGQESVKELTRIEMNYAFAQKQLADSLIRAKQALEMELVHQQEVAAQRDQRNIAFYGGAGILLLAGGLWSRLRYVRRSRAVIQKERDRSDELLLNILPEETASELKEKGSAEAKYHPEVTVLFTDFKGFTAISEQLGPKELVRDIHECFSAFDRIMEEFGIEKIKTIGDAYMAVSGLPTPNTSHALDVVKAAFAIQAFIEKGAEEKKAEGAPWFEVRVGIHTGPVVSGIVGVRKFQYDIWGDTVNTAARMESSGEVGRVNISAGTHAKLKDVPGLRFIPRGKLEAKGKGPLEMYFVEPV